MSEKILFEMRVSRDQSGTHVEINASPEWRAYHRPHHRAFAWMGCCEDEGPAREDKSTAADLRRTLDSLQSIYDDLYGRPAGAG